MTKVYQQAFTEVYEILSYLDETNYNKIPIDILNSLEKNRDINYDFIIDTSIPIYEQDILEESKAILFNLYRDYLANSEIKNQIIKYQREEQNELERIKKEKYDYNNIFEKNKSHQVKKINSISENNQNALISNNIPKVNIFLRLLQRIKKLWNNT